MKTNKEIEFLQHIYGKSIKVISNEDMELQKYINKLDLLIRKITNSNRKFLEYDIATLKELFYNKYIINKENISDSLYQGLNKIEKEEELNRIVTDQKESLNRWINFLIGKDMDKYPIWYRYYIFRSVVSLGTYDKERHKFNRRTKNTVKPYVDLNVDAIDFIYNELLHYFNEKDIEDLDLYKLLSNGNFGKIYAHVLTKMNYSKEENGIWKKYDRGSAHLVLYSDIYGHNTNWCTANGIQTAKKQLQSGDFYIYFTKDNNGLYTIPRIAIRKIDGMIGEIRGIAKDQNIEPNMEEILNKKLEENEFSDRDLYRKKINDMKKLTSIYDKWKSGCELNKEELRFLYEIDDVIIGFGYFKDPRIKEIINTRDIRNDLIYVLGCNSDEISLTLDEALRGNIKYHYGNLNLRYVDLSSMKIELPENVNGNIFISSKENLKIRFPEIVNGDLYAGTVENLSNTNLPKIVYGNVDFNSLKVIDNIIFPERVYGNISLNELISEKGLVLPQTVGGNVNLDSLVKVDKLTLPDKIFGNLSMKKLISAKGVSFSSFVGGDLCLDSIISSDDLFLPKIIVGSLYLSMMKEINYLKLPDIIGDSLAMWEVEEIKELIMPDSIGGAFATPKLKDISGVVLSNKYTKENLIHNLENAIDPYLIELTSNSISLINQIKSENKLVKSKTL